MNTLLILCTSFFLYMGIKAIIRYKKEGFWLFLTFMMFSMFGIGITEVKTSTTYQDPAAMMVKDGTLVVIDSNKAVHVINNYENGMVCIETRKHERLIPIFNESFVSVNTKCQNVIK